MVHIPAFPPEWQHPESKSSFLSELQFVLLSNRNTNTRFVWVWDGKGIFMQCLAERHIQWAKNIIVKIFHFKYFDPRPPF